MSSAGDINGDGYDDVIIGALWADSIGNSRLNDGEAYVIFGKQSGLADIDLASMTNAQGFRLFGPGGDHAGISVSGAGDINGDTFADIIIGVPNAGFGGGAPTGRSYVIFGTKDGLADVDLKALAPEDGFFIHSTKGLGAGDAVSTAGDVNGDGFSDLILGSRDVSGAGSESFVIFGHSGKFSNLDLATLSGANGFTIKGAKDNDGAGDAVSSAGDINNDGLDDLIIGARLADGPAGEVRLNAGASYVIFGQTNFDASIDLASLAPDEGFTIHGARGSDLAGTSVSAAGDVNNDGFADLIVGAPNGDFPQPLAGREGVAYVLYGHAGGFANIDLKALSATAGFRHRRS